MHTYLHSCTKIEEEEMKLTVNDGLDIGALAAEDNSFVNKSALATAPVILLESRHGRLVKLLTLLDLLLDCLFLSGGKVLGLSLLEACLDGDMEAVVKDAVVRRRSG